MYTDAEWREAKRNLTAFFGVLAEWENARTTFEEGRRFGQPLIECFWGEDFKIARRHAGEFLFACESCGWRYESPNGFGKKIIDHWRKVHGIALRCDARRSWAEMIRD